MELDKMKGEPPSCLLLCVRRRLCVLLLPFAMPNWILSVALDEHERNVARF